MIRISATLFLFLLLSNCTTTPECEYPPTTVVALIDMSGVRENQAVRQSYAENFNSLMSKIHPCSHLSVARITEASLMEQRLLANETFESFKPTTDNDMYRAAELEQYLKQFEAKKKSIGSMVRDTILFSPRIASQTDLFGAMGEAAAIFKKIQNERQILVLFSDMEQYTAEYKFPNLKLDDNQVNEIIAAQNKKAGGMPQLQGVRVFVIGAHSASNERFLAIRNFWLNYFEACGADCRQEDYGGALINFD
jgi:hypothetical protein